MLLCAFNAACWAAPLRFKRFTGSSQKLGVASTFSGGVFLALAFGHMVPEAAEAFGEGGAAAACRWTLGGYLLIWAVERLANGAEAPVFRSVGLGRGGRRRRAGAAPPAEAQTSGSAAMLLGALSVHSMLETMALAVARSKSAAALLAGSIALHQPAESLALVVALLRAGLRGPKLLRLLLLFTAMGPLGCVAGLGLHALRETVWRRLGRCIDRADGGHFCVRGRDGRRARGVRGRRRLESQGPRAAAGRGDDPRSRARRGPARGESRLKSIDSSYLV